MYQRRPSAHVAPVSAGPIHRHPRRAARAGRRDWALLVAGLAVVGLALALLRLNPLRGHPSPVVAVMAHDPRTAPSTVAGHPRPLRSDAAPPLPPPFTWDYRWLAAHAPAGAPQVRARSGILVDAGSGRVLWDLQPHASLPMASTTKLMTAMVAMDNITPETVMTVPPEVDGLEKDGTMMGLTVGETVTVQQLLYGLLLDSGNDAAETLADGTLGHDAFVAAMNVRARRMALSDTHFANPWGMDDPGQRSSAHDLAEIAATLYRHYPGLEQVVTTRSLWIPPADGHKGFNPTNFDKMLWTYPGAIGFKTGNTDGAGQCLVTGATRGGRTLVVVLLNDDLIFTDATKLLDYGFRA